MLRRDVETGSDTVAVPPWKTRQRSAGVHHTDEAPPACIKRPMKGLHRRPRQWGCAGNAVLLAFIIAVPSMVVFFGARTSAPVVWINAADALRLGSAAPAHDRLLGGLLADGVDERSCHGRYQSASYRRRAGRQPSRYLVSKLRLHEALQRRCGPGTAAYSHAQEQLRSGKKSHAGAGSPECKYLVSISYRGLGNRILAAASAFLYAVLTDRVLLVDPSNEMDELFCEPFPGTTWVLPPGFPLTSYTNFSIATAESHANMVRNKVISTADAAQELPAFAYIHLDHDADGQDKQFYCDEDQRVLRDIQWLVMRTDSYIVPGLFLVMAFQEELAMLFPEPDTVFHHLGRYLFHPSNHVWGLVARYHDAYLAAAHHKVGIQVRVFGREPNSPELLEQITTCTQKEGLLPELHTATITSPPPPPPPPRRSKAVLVTSLKGWYYEQLKSMYWEHATVTGEAVGVHQPSHEEYQHFGARSHDTKAWAEIYLLSLTDVLVTSSSSTFGYVAQGLGGLTPWVMFRPDNNGSVVPCARDVSMEPCFHAPAFYDCRIKQGADPSNILPQVKHCKDVGWGLKLVVPSL